MQRVSGEAQQVELTGQVGVGVGVDPNTKERALQDVVVGAP